MKKTLVIALAAAMCVSMVPFYAYAEDAAPAETQAAEAPAEGESAEAAEGESSGESAEAAAPSQENQITEGEQSYSDVQWSGADGYLYIDGGSATVGGDENTYNVDSVMLPVTEKYYESSAFKFDNAVNSVFTGTQDAAGGGNIFQVTGTDSKLFVNNIYATAQGSQTAVMYTDGSNDVMVVNDSYIEAKGSVDGYLDVSDFMALQGLLVWGHTRTNLSQGYTSTYYYNSAVIADGWAAMSTDGATGLGVNFVAVNSYAETTDGGYAIYSDHECRDYVFGTTLVGAEYGAIIAAGGELYMFDGDALDVNNQELNAWRDQFLKNYPAQLMETSYQDFAAEHPVHALDYYNGAVSIGRSQLVGGRNCILVHKPDEGHEGTAAATQNVFVAIGTDLIVDHTLFNLDDMPEGWYTPQDVTSSASFFKDETLNYVKFTSGAGILIRSCSTDIYLEDVTFESNYNEADFGQADTFIMAVLNSDGNANLIPDGETANPMTINVVDSDIKGNIVDMDYQRAMNITLDGTSLTGKIDWKNVDDWNAMWGEGGTLGNGAYKYDDTYATVWGPTIVLKNGSIWTVTEESYIKDYMLDGSSQIIGDITAYGNGYKVTPKKDEQPTTQAPTTQATTTTAAPTTAAPTTPAPTTTQPETTTAAPTEPETTTSEYMGYTFGGQDPWGNEISVTLRSESNGQLTWTYTENFPEGQIYKELTTPYYSGYVEKWTIDGTLGGDLGGYTYHYEGNLQLQGGSVMLTFTDGQMTQGSVEGDNASYQVGPAKESGLNTVELKKQN